MAEALETSDKGVGQVAEMAKPTGATMRSELNRTRFGCCPTYPTFFSATQATPVVECMQPDIGFGSSGRRYKWDHPTGRFGEYGPGMVVIYRWIE